MVIERFGDAQSFKLKVNPSTQLYFGHHDEVAVMGDYPTLNDLNAAYGTNFAAEWMAPHIADISIHTGSKNLTKEHIRSLVLLIATEYRHLKITELLLFFHRFKAGAYGRFYGSVDPMVITCALREFMQDRANIINACESRKAMEHAEKLRNDPNAISYEQWQEMKRKMTTK